MKGSSESTAIFHIGKNKSDFINLQKSGFINLQKINDVSLRGIGGDVSVPMKGTVKWKVQDDTGKTHEILIEDAYYVPEAPISLLCPRQWAQQPMKYENEQCFILLSVIFFKMNIQREPTLVR